MKKIPLSRGLFALVDDDDFEFLNQWKWYAAAYGKGYTYAVRTLVRPNGNNGVLKMHRVIMNAPTDMVVDHKNHDCLDNRKSNLRICSRSQNSMNSCARRGTASGLKGVCRAKKGMWTAGIRVQGKMIHLGTFSDKALAAKAYDQAAVKYFKDFAKLNFPEALR
jgi:hypothetical protein